MGNHHFCRNVRRFAGSVRPLLPRQRRRPGRYRMMLFCAIERFHCLEHLLWSRHRFLDADVFHHSRKRVDLARCPERTPIRLICPPRHTALSDFPRVPAPPTSTQVYAAPGGQFQDPFLPLRICSVIQHIAGAQPCQFAPSWPRCRLWR